jgi:hypothetical protein
VAVGVGLAGAVIDAVGVGVEHNTGFVHVVGPDEVGGAVTGEVGSPPPRPRQNGWSGRHVGVLDGFGLAFFFGCCCTWTHLFPVKTGWV